MSRPNISRHPYGNSKQRRQERREQATERQAERDKLSPAQQLKRLDKIFGKGKGAARERARLTEVS